MGRSGDSTHPVTLSPTLPVSRSLSLSRSLPAASRYLLAVLQPAAACQLPTTFRSPAPLRPFGFSLRASARSLPLETQIPRHQLLDRLP